MNMRESPRENAARHASSESRREEEILNAPIIAITARNHPIGDLCDMKNEPVTVTLLYRQIRPFLMMWANTGPIWANTGPIWANTGLF